MAKIKLNIRSLIGNKKRVVLKFQKHKSKVSPPRREEEEEATSNFLRPKKWKTPLNLERKRLARIQLPQQVKMVLLGSLLGDGAIGIQKNSKNARFQMRHSSMQKEWFDWKSGVLASIGSANAIHFSKPDGFQRNRPLAHPPGEPWGKYHFQSLALKELTELYEIIRKGNKKNVQRSWLNHLNAQALMVWWFDDGGLQQKLKKGMISTHGFSKKEVNVISKYFKKVWELDNIVSKVQKNGVYYNGIRLNTTNLKKLLRIIAPHVPVKSMVYKLCIGYVEREQQQRWISELEALLPPEFFPEVVKFYINFNRSKDKA